MTPIRFSIRATLLGLVILICCPQLFGQDPDDEAAQRSDLELKAQQRVQAREALDAGMTAFQSRNYQQAIEHFKNAVFLDDTLTAAKVQMALVYTQLYVPGNQSADNLRMVHQAIQEYQEVLQQDSRSLESLKGVGKLYMQTGDFGAAIETYKRLIEITSDDPEPYYLVGVIDWTLAYGDTERRKSAAGFKVDDYMESPEVQKLCNDLNEVNQARVQEGLRMLQAAIERRPDYDDAFAYMALLYRREADLACNDLQARTKSLKLSEEWADRALASRKKKEAGTGKSEVPKTPR